MANKNWNGALKKKRNYRPFVITLSIILIGAIGILSGLSGYEVFDAFDITILPLMNSICNNFSCLFLLIDLFSSLYENFIVHFSFIYAVFTTTFLFLLTYVTFHFLSPSTPYGGSGFLAGLYYFVLITHIILAAAIVPLALTSIT